MTTKGTIKYSTYVRSTNLIKNRFINIQKAVNTLVADIGTTPISLVQSRTLSTYINEVRKKRNDWEGNFARVLDSDEASEEDLTQHMESINDLYVSVVSQIEAVMPPDDPLSPTSTSGDKSGFPQTPPTAQPNVQLPRLELKTFSGNPTEWVSFLNLFNSSVHQNNSLSSVLKMQYLVSCLKGEPLNMVKSLPLTAANYPIAYNLLSERYHNTRRLLALHLNAVLDLPSVNSNNSKSLRNFLNLFMEHTQSLSALKCNITDSNPLLSAHLLRKLDSECCKRLEAYRTTLTCEPHSLPSVDQIIKFLNNEYNYTEDSILHSTPAAKPSDKSIKLPHQQSPKQLAHQVYQASTPTGTRQAAQVTPATRRTGSTSSNASPECFICKQESHKVYSCPVFLSKTPSERSQLVRIHDRCFCCLGAHKRNKCLSKHTCKTCHQSHHSLLHFDKSTQVNVSTSPIETVMSSNQVVASASVNSSPSLSQSSQSTVVLGTALVKLTSSNGHSQVLRCLLDSGSQLSFISERAVQLLGAPRVHASHDIVGISSTTSRTKGFVELNLSSLSDKLIASQHSFHILDRISAQLPRVKLASEMWQLTRPFILADPTYHLPGTVDVLLGGDLYPLILTQDRHSLGLNLPHLIGTLFGYVVMGTAPCDNSSIPNSYFVVMHSAEENQTLHECLQKFWLQEEPAPSSRKSAEEELCDKHFAQTHTRTEDGRYEVRLPFKPNQSPLGQSRQTAEKRLLSLERKFTANPQFKDLYVTYMKDCEAAGYITKLADVDPDTPHSFLPHHGVLKSVGPSTKLRVVYDASCKTSSGLSLNDVLMTGPKLQTNISDILLHFRTHNIVFTCDIRQMYLQILVHPSDHLFQLILWRERQIDPISIFKLNQVTFGVNCSPFLAIRTLQQLAKDEGHAFPQAAKVLTTSTYIDDIVTGADTVEEAQQLQDQLIKLLSLGHFELRKWTSNSPDLLQTLPEAHRDTPVFLEGTNEPHFSILGLKWSPDSDAFTYDLNPPSAQPTKRHVLSTVARMYDPCGFIAPCIMLAKSFMQLLWTQGLQWDEPLAPDLKKRWNSFVSDLLSLAAISIPRAFQLSASTRVEVHGFSDASEVGYAAVLYFRCLEPNGDVVVRQVLAKTKVAPLKRVTLPRLELCAAHLLAQLTSYCLTLLKDKLTPVECVLWSDSLVALTWLRTPSYQLKTYVANRVAQAQELVPSSSWRYLPSKDNPADCASRGIMASELVNHPLWWKGPSWLSQPPSSWPTAPFTPVNLQASGEVKTNPLTSLIATKEDQWGLLERFSSWNKLQRMVAYILRFIHNSRQPDKRRGALTVHELQEATLRICRLVQASTFSEEISLLRKTSSCSSRLQRLAPFIDKDGVLRVGGRLRKSKLSYEAAHPILLPKKHPVVTLLVNYYHQMNLHSGPQLTQALISQHFWILTARQVIRSQILKCVTCFRNKPRNSPPFMGDLPSTRVRPSRPFSSTGCDYCGPFQAKIHNLRAVRKIKVYLCIFICLATKAVHIEVVTDLTTEAFVAALVRFTSRRGLPRNIFSDCGTNFVGADAAIRRLISPTTNSKEAQEQIILFTSQRGIQFHFNAPASPHMGGLWEGAVKSAKHHLRRVMGDTALPLTELSTLVAQVEAALNSRPLTPLSDDPSDVSALTPGHFLIGASLSAVPEPNLSSVPLNRLKHWQLVQALHQRFWKRWQLEYLHTLQQRNKWTKKTQNLKIGDLVLIHMNSPPFTWPLARVAAIHPGSDGVVRVVDLKTATGHLTRPVVKIFRLPIE